MTNNRTSYNYTGGEYFSILIDQLEEGRKVISKTEADKNDIMPHMKTHLKRIRIENIKSLVFRIDEILNLSEDGEIAEDIVDQLQIFKDKIHNC